MSSNRTKITSQVPVSNTPKKACKNSPTIYPNWPQEISHNSNKIAPTMKQNDQQYITQIMVKTSLDFMQNQQEKWSSKIISLNWSNKAQESSCNFQQCMCTFLNFALQNKAQFAHKICHNMSNKNRAQSMPKTIHNNI